MPKLRVGVIGAGMAFERLHYPAYMNLADTYRIVAVCDPDREKLCKWQVSLGLSSQDFHTDWEAIVARDDMDVYEIMVQIEQNQEVTEAEAKRIKEKKKKKKKKKPFHKDLAENGLYLCILKEDIC